LTFPGWPGLPGRINLKFGVDEPKARELEYKFIVGFIAFLENAKILRK
jgi:hypothetical protein